MGFEVVRGFGGQEPAPEPEKDVMPAAEKYVPAKNKKEALKRLVAAADAWGEKFGGQVFARGGVKHNLYRAIRELQQFDKKE